MFEQPCKVNLGDNRSSLAYGKGTYNLVADLNGHNQNIVLHEVLFIPDLGKNMLSVRVMVKLVLKGICVKSREIQSYWLWEKGVESYTC
jgi:hypothetical protein